ncbi:hypothetical protein QVD17_09637 [Tagetes erecta]|uniref:Uncharacterized protein n=1 Tax=Tagetes erecta TaxID=13708 RepID=A0AAD8P580_TARER|nr:hypothetical protein QVD17_09637 [Tagetes erecta]
MGRFVSQNIRPILHPRVPLNHQSSEPLNNPVRFIHPATNKTHFTPLIYRLLRTISSSPCTSISLLHHC